MYCDLLFDLDQTLLDFHASEQLALKAVMEDADLTFTEERYAFFKQANKALWLGFEKGLISKPGLFEERFRRLFEECGCDTSGIDLLRHRGEADIEPCEVLDDRNDGRPPCASLPICLSKLSDSHWITIRSCSWL